MTVWRIGTRGSRLARRQTELALAALRQRYPELDLTVQPIETEGDRRTDLPLARAGGQGIFVKELERALHDGRIDLAVHSLKDLPSQPAEGLQLAAFLPREDPRDVLVSRNGVGLATLPAGARVATSSPRRVALVRAVRPDLDLVDVRGNVDTRLAKLQAGQFEALILAAAGLHRLGLADVVSEYLPLETFVPAPGQGILALQCRADDAAIVERLAALDDPASRLAATIERACLAALGPGCQLPFGAHAEVTNTTVTLRVVLFATATPRRYQGTAGIDRAHDLIDEARAALGLSRPRQETP